MSVGAAWNCAFRLAAAIVLIVLVVATSGRRVDLIRAFDIDEEVRTERSVQPLTSARVISDDGHVERDADVERDARVDVVRPITSMESTVDDASSTSETRRDERSRSASCALHVFRHVSKTGGTTMRFLFDRQTVLGTWEAPIPYGATEEEWTTFREAWREAAKGSAEGERETPPRALVEVRGHHPSSWSAANFERVVMEDLKILREEFNETCSVTSSYLVRRPVDQYASYYDYYVRHSQEEERAKELSGNSTKNTWGRSVHDWAAVKPDLQTRELLWKEQCVHSLRVAPFDEGHTWAEDCLVVSDEEWSRVMKMFDAFDVVGTTDRFNEFLLLVGKVAGIESLRYVYSNAGKSVHSVDKEALEKTIKNVTTRDAELYSTANAALNRAIKSTFGSIDSFRKDVLAPFESATIESSHRKYVGGKPESEPKYKWVRAKDAKSHDVTSIELPMWVMPDGGGQARAYMISEPVVMVERAACSAPCVKGCNFD